MKAGKVSILNIDIANYTFQEFLENLREGVVFTPNVDHIMKLQKDRDFYEVYSKADHLVCDSRVVQVTSSWVSKEKIRDQIAGSDFFPAFCQYHRNNTDRIKVFLLGGTEESVVLAMKNINQKAGSQVIIGGYSPPFGFEKDEAESRKMIDMVNQSGATVVAVGVGAPKQEKWIMQYKDQMPGVDIFFAIGATIDFQAGFVRRSPRWITAVGMEWAYRMVHEPKRLFKRYIIDDMPFFLLLLKQRFGLYQNPWG